MPQEFPAHRALVALALCLTAALCGCGDGNDGVGGVTASEARALNEAAEMLDTRAMPVAMPKAGDTQATGNQTGNAAAR